MSQADLPPYTIRPYRPGDEHELVKLFERVNGRSITTDHYLWKFCHLPSPVENVWLAVVDEWPIFHYAAMPIPYRLPGGSRTVMTSVDIMTDPDWQRQGILTAVGGRTYRTWAEAGIPFTFGLPNERWGTRTKAVGLEPLFPLQWFTRLLRPTTTLKNRFLKPPTHSPPSTPHSPYDRLWNRWWNRSLTPDPTIEIEQVEQAGEVFDELWRLCEGDKTVSIIRDRAWVDWRFLAAPSADYQLFLARRNGRPAGYIATRLTTDGPVVKGLIVEWLAPAGDEAVRRTLLGHALDYLAVHGAQSAATQAVPDTPDHVLLRRAGFLGRAAFTVWLAPYDKTLPMAVMADRHQWRLYGGDFDVV